MVLEKAKLLDLYERMVRIRGFEQTARDTYKDGFVSGSVHLYTGEEAVAAGVCAALESKDFITSTHRGHGHLVAKGGDLKKMMAELFGKVTGYCKGKGGSMHICDMDLGILGSNGIVGAGLPIVVGSGFASKQLKTGAVSVCFFGDGASNRGTFHESLNLASAWKLPVIYALENNYYGISGSQRELTNVEDISVRAQAYGVAGKTVDGNDVLAVYEAAVEAVERARKGEGPTLLEFKTWRHWGHWEGDPDELGFIYRQKEEHEQWLSRDPIKLYRERLLAEKLADESELNEIDDRTRKALEEAVEFAMESPLPTVDSLYDDVFA